MRLEELVVGPGNAEAREVADGEAVDELADQTADAQRHMQVEQLLAGLVHRPAEEVFGHVVIAAPRAMEGLRRVLRRLHRDVAAGVARADDENTLANENVSASCTRRNESSRR